MGNHKRLEEFFVGTLAVLIGIMDLLLRPIHGGLMMRDLWSRNTSIFAILMLLAIIFWANKNKHTVVLYLAFIIFWTILLSL